jgi:hypothetical protein
MHNRFTGLYKKYRMIKVSLGQTEKIADPVRTLHYFDLFGDKGGECYIN